VANDPCGLVPDSNIPTGLPLSREHAVYHVVGRIRHRLKPRPKRVLVLPVLPNGLGCEKHVLAEIVPAMPKLPAAPATTVAGLGATAGLAVLFGGSARPLGKAMHKPSGHGRDGGTPVPEPSSAIILFVAFIILLAARRLNRNGPFGARRVGALCVRR
jgi:hypothetical protein